MLDEFKKQPKKINTNITLSPEIKEWAVKEQLNLSKILEERLKELRNKKVKA